MLTKLSQAQGSDLHSDTRPSHSISEIDWHGVRDLFLPVIELSATATLIVDEEEALIVACNEAFTQISGFSDDYIKGFRLQQLIKPADERQGELSSNPNRAELYRLQCGSQKSLLVSCEAKTQLYHERKLCFVSMEVAPQLAMGQPSWTRSDLLLSRQQARPFIWMVDKQGFLQKCNHKARQLFSIAEEEKAETINFSRLLAAIKGRDREKLKQHFQLVLDEGKKSSFALEGLFATGYHRFNITLYPLGVSTQEVNGVSFVAHEQSEANLEDSLHETLEDFKAGLFHVFELSELECLMDEALAKMSFSTHCLLRFSAKGSEMIGECAEDSHENPGQAEEIRALCQEVHDDRKFLDRREDRQNGKAALIVPVVAEGVLKYGIYCSSDSLMGSQPELYQETLEKTVYLFLIRYQSLVSNQQLETVNRSFRAIIDSTPNAFMLFDTDFRIVASNRTAQKGFKNTLGLRLTRGMAFGEFIPLKHAISFEHYCREALAGNISTVDRQYKHPVEGVFWYRITFAPARDEDEQIFGVTVIMTNVTAERQAEQQMLYQNRELVKANKELDKFVYSVSHDLRAPIANTIGLITIMKAEGVEGEMLRYANMIESTMRRMDAFIHQILDYSRNNRLELKLETVNCREVIEEMLEDFGYYNKSAQDIDFRLKVAEDSAIYTDRQRLKIIVNNLISNAIKYHDEDKEDKFIEVSLTADAENSYLTIRDNGQGIKEEHIPHLFEMFYTANLRAEGSGIGLYILKDATEQLKGKIGVKSKFGEGSEFLITLPKLQ